MTNTKGWAAGPFALGVDVGTSPDRSSLVLMRRKGEAIIILDVMSWTTRRELLDREALEMVHLENAIQMRAAGLRAGVLPALRDVHRQLVRASVIRLRGLRWALDQTPPTALPPVLQGSTGLDFVTPGAVWKCRACGFLMGRRDAVLVCAAQCPCGGKLLPEEVDS